MTTVVDVRSGKFDEYVGRAVPRAKDPRCRVRSVYANPYPIMKYRSRAMSLVFYEGLWRQRLAGKRRQLWLGRLCALVGKRLGCWCKWPKPLPCHADVLVRLIEEFCPAASEVS